MRLLRVGDERCERPRAVLRAEGSGGQGGEAEKHADAASG
jgi:hypothetical protein